MNENHDSIGIIVLAAGGSRRMNEPKQLLEFEGKNLLQRAVETAVESIYKPVIVVLGANYELTKSQIEDLKIEIVYNEDWRSGLSSSIKFGFEKLVEIAPEISACIITLADQPFVKSQHLNLFAEEFRLTNKPIIAAEYNKTLGVPALFSRVFFADFGELSGDQGAKPIIEKHRENLSTIALPEAAFDIDTPEDFSQLVNKN